MALTKSVATLVAAATSNAAAATTRGVLDCRTYNGGRVTYKMTNGATGPTLQCTARLLVAHNTGATPAAGSAGADWKTIGVVVGNGVAINAINEWSYEFDADVEHLEIEFTGNTGQAVVVEAFVSAYIL